MTISEYKDMIQEALEKLEQLNQRQIELEETKEDNEHELSEIEYECNKLKSTRDKLKQDKEKVLHLKSIKKTEKISSLLQAGIMEFLCAPFWGLSTIFTKGATLPHWVIAGIVTALVGALCTWRYHVIVSPIKQLKKDARKGKINLEEEIRILNEKISCKEIEMETIQKACDQIVLDLNSIEEEKVETTKKNHVYKQSLYAVIEEELKDIDIDDRVNQKMIELEKEKSEPGMSHVKRIEYKNR